MGQFWAIWRRYLGGKVLIPLSILGVLAGCSQGRHASAPIAPPDRSTSPPWHANMAHVTPPPVVAMKAHPPAGKVARHRFSGRVIKHKHGHRVSAKHHVAVPRKPHIRTKQPAPQGR